MLTKKFLISLLLLLLLPFWTVESQRKSKEPEFTIDPEIDLNQNPKVKAENDKRMSLQWYVIEPFAKYCTEDIANAPEDSELSNQIVHGSSEFRIRLHKVTLRDLTGIPVVKLNRTMEEQAKFRIASDLITMYRRGKCKEGR